MEERRLIISIGRQYGSGGSEVGAKLAEELGVNFYDKNILRMNSDESGIKESYFHLADEKAGNKLLYKIISGMIPEKKAPSFGADLVSADNLFRFQSEVIRKLAAEESCVIIGRCADYVLDGAEGLVRIFIYSDMESRIERIVRKGIAAKDDAPKMIKRMDRERRDYYRYYTGKDWSSAENYDIMINTAKLGIDGTIKAIKNYLILRGFEI
ncbi:cytidylate kinase-like family protein [Clostridium sp. AM58-1XD]|uniref:cytidylate kinase-like family protein n=1 Tax=Clostridium sp. AM58-1XD TaxID=2292307 RepID=UPI000E51D088|nr:cytidylate kinase-like family protein [Clostridium sp. AM58-1XD]